MKPSLLLYPAVLVMLSCNNPFHSTQPAQLSEAAIYEIDSVTAAIGSGNEKDAGKKLSRAIDIYKNEKDAAKSIDLFKTAILAAPSAKAYFMLGSALLDDGRYAEASRALHIAEQLHYSPLANVMFKLAASYAPHKDQQRDQISVERDSAALHYMELAIQMGYAYPEQFNNLPQFALLKENYAFRRIYYGAVSGGSGGKSPEKMLWQSFIAGFPAAPVPLTINTVYIHDHPLDNTISFDFEKFVPEMRNARFSREIHYEYYYFALVKKEPAYTALLYAGKNHYLTDASQNSPVFFFLTTYDPNGKIIDKMPVAGQEDFTAPFKVLTIHRDYTFEVKDYKNIFKYDPETIGYDSNYVVRSEPLGNAVFRIGANGKFEKTGAPLALR